jgi:hypothetical protein
MNGKLRQDAHLLQIVKNKSAPEVAKVITKPEIVGKTKDGRVLVAMPYGQIHDMTVGEAKKIGVETE